MTNSTLEAIVLLSGKQPDLELVVFDPTVVHVRLQWLVLTPDGVFVERHPPRQERLL